MTPSEIAAYIGAAAWLPPIIYLVCKFFVKPKVELVPAPNPEIGYTTFGPILNLNCAISASNRDAIINKIDLKVKHEKGQMCALTWATLNETFSEITSVTGEHAEVSKRQPAVALKVGTVVLAEKMIGFQDPKYRQKSNELINKLLEFYNHKKKTHPNEFNKLSLQSKEYADLLDFYKKSSFWQEGRYTAELIISVTELNGPTRVFFEFTLSKNDIERISQNITELERVLHDYVEPPQQQKRDHWNWLNPAIKVIK